MSPSQILQLVPTRPPDNLRGARVKCGRCGSCGYCGSCGRCGKCCSRGRCSSSDSSLLLIIILNNHSDYYHYHHRRHHHHAHKHRQMDGRTEKSDGWKNSIITAWFSLPVPSESSRRYATDGNYFLLD